VLARERSDHGFSGESRGGHARRERLPQAGLRGSHRRWAARHSLSGRTQGATARHVATPTPERCFSTAVVFTGTSGRIVHREKAASIPHSPVVYRSRYKTSTLALPLNPSLYSLSNGCGFIVGAHRDGEAV